MSIYSQFQNITVNMEKLQAIPKHHVKFIVNIANFMVNNKEFRVNIATIMVNFKAIRVNSTDL